MSMCMQNFIKLFNTVQEIEPVSRFQNLNLGKASTDNKWQLGIPFGLGLVNIKVLQSFIKISLMVQE